MPKRVGLAASRLDKSEPYADALRLVGLEPVLSFPSLPVNIGEVDGLLLSGGSDVNPALYGEERDPRTEPSEDDRDRMELELLAQAVAHDMPVLAICRGLQLLNVAQGGTLQQHMEGHVQRPVNPGDPAHRVRVITGSQLARIVGTDALPVNSRHHQAVKTLGRGLRVSAVAENDETVEGLELEAARFVIAVQWHPENQVTQSDRQRALFEALATAVERDSAHC